MLTYFSIKSFDQIIQDDEMRLKRTEKRFGKDSSAYRTQSKALELRKKHIAKARGAEGVSKPLAESEVSGG